MKVYILCSVDFAETNVLRAFSSLELAKAYYAKEKMEQDRTKHEIAVLEVDDTQIDLEIIGF